MFDFATLATGALTDLQTQFESLAPAMFATSLVVLGAFVGLRLMKGGVKAAFSK